MTRGEAFVIRDASIKRIMQERGCTYPIARAGLHRERTAMSREISQKASQLGCTRAAAFWLLQQEKNNRSNNEQ